MPCKDCLNRREFLAKSAFAAAALAAIEGCGDGQIGPTAITAGGALTIHVPDFPGLATVGTIVEISFDKALVRTGPTTFRGLTRICTHEGCQVHVKGAAATQLECECHLSLFANDGTVLRGPNVANNGIAPLPQLTVVYDQAANTVSVS